MLNELMDAVTRRLCELFGDGYTIYTDAVEQGLETPCFFVQFLEPSEKPVIGRRYFRENGLCIQFLPGNEVQPSRAVNQAADRLMDGMEQITLADGRRLNGTQRSWKEVDGVLNFFVSFNQFFLKDQLPAEPMAEVSVKGVSG